MDDGIRGWGIDLRAERRRLGNSGGGGRWLKEEKELFQNSNWSTENRAQSDCKSDHFSNAGVNASNSIWVADSVKKFNKIVVIPLNPHSSNETAISHNGKFYARGKFKPAGDMVWMGQEASKIWFGWATKHNSK